MGRGRMILLSAKFISLESTYKDRIVYNSNFRITNSTSPVRLLDNLLYASGAWNEIYSVFYSFYKE
jgi:hypothetical protein